MPSKRAILTKDREKPPLKIDDVNNPGISTKNKEREESKGGETKMVENKKERNGEREKRTNREIDKETDGQKNIQIQRNRQTKGPTDK